VELRIICLLGLVEVSVIEMAFTIALGILIALVILLVIAMLFSCVLWVMEQFH